MKKQLIVLAVVLCFSVSGASKGYSFTSYALMEGSTIEIDSNPVALTGQFSLVTNTLILIVAGKLIPTSDLLKYSLDDIELQGGDISLTGRQFDYFYPGSIFPGSNISYNATIGAISSMAPVSVSNEILQETYNSRTVLSTSLTPINPLDSQYNYFSNIDSEDYLPDEVLLSYLLKQSTERYWSETIDPECLESVSIPCGTSVGLYHELISSNTVGSITIHAHKISPVPLPAAAWFLGSGLVGLVSFHRKKSNGWCSRNR